MRILYVEDYPHDADLILRRMRKQAPHLQFEIVSTIRDALVRLEQLSTEPLDLVFAEMRLPDGDGLMLLQHIRQNNLPLAVVIASGKSDAESAVAAFHAGTDDYFVKRRDYLDRLPLILENALNRYRAGKLMEESLKSALAEVQQLKDRLHEENIYLQEEIRGAGNFGEIVGNSPALNLVLREAEQVAPLNTTVLILGETGTGKELLVHAIHKLSTRHNHPLVKVNCGALPAPLIESELFGHEKGAFTGADTRRCGRFALANGGTLFLDEVGELPLELQSKLLRVLEQSEFELLGSSRTIKADVRVIAATNRNLSEAVANGTFRSDLFYRLSIFPLTMPPLRERREDIPMLVTYLVGQMSAKLGKNIETIPQSALRVLQEYDWPGNVRELRNVIERAVIVTQGSKLQLTEMFEPLAQRVDESQPEEDFESETLEQSEYRLILRTLKKVHWRVEGPGGAADLLDVHASTRSRMRKLGIVRPKVKGSSG